MRTEHQRRTYERPDLLEVGSAKRLTLAGDGCRPDGQDCKAPEDERS